jgi:hypothetical protein
MRGLGATAAGHTLEVLDDFSKDSAMIFSPVQ